MASLMVLSIETITSSDKIMATTNNTSVVVFTNWLTLATVSFGFEIQKRMPENL